MVSVLVMLLDGIGSDYATLFYQGRSVWPTRKQELIVLRMNNAYGISEWNAGRNLMA